MDAPISLTFQVSLPYLAADPDSRPLPRLPIRLALSESDRRLGRLWPLLDTGADYTMFDGAVAVELGWTEADIASRAEDVRPVSGVGRGAGPLTGYLHRLTCYVPLGARYAVLPLRVLLTPPYTLATPVLGRHDFFAQVDFGLAEAERRCYLRVRDPAAVHAAWTAESGR